MKGGEAGIRGRKSSSGKESEHEAGTKGTWQGDGKIQKGRGKSDMQRWLMDERKMRGGCQFI